MTSSRTTTATAAQKILNPLLIRRLYRLMLKTAKPFTSSQLLPHTDTGTTSKDAVVETPPITARRLRTPIVMNCLLHRTGYDDESWMDFLRGFTSTTSTTIRTTNNHSPTTTNHKIMMDLLSPEEREQTLFRILLREVLCGGGNGGTVPPFQPQNDDSNTNDHDHPESHIPNPNERDSTTPPPPPTSTTASSSASLGVKIMQFPIHVRHNPNRIYHIIQREFRIPLEQHIFDATTRQNIAFRCIREMNKKIVYAYQCEQKLDPSSSTSATGSLQQKLSRTLPPTLSIPNPISEPSRTIANGTATNGETCTSIAIGTIFLLFTSGSIFIGPSTYDRILSSIGHLYIGASCRRAPRSRQ
jgi:hypothetical protein